MKFFAGRGSFVAQYGFGVALVILALLSGCVAVPAVSDQAAFPVRNPPTELTGTVTAERITAALIPVHGGLGNTRGIRNSSGDPTISLRIEFSPGSAELTPASRRLVDTLGRSFNSAALAGYRFRIEGHTDTVGTAAANQELSARRAARVVDYLVENFRINRVRLEPVGLGESDPIVPRPDQTPEPRNRRVQVVNLGTI